MDATLANLLASEDPFAWQQANEKREELEILKRLQDRARSVTSGGEPAEAATLAPLPTAAVTTSSVSSAPGGELHNPRMPFYIVQHETPQHRDIVLMYARGMKIVDIARVTGRTTVNISVIVKQPWARLMMAKLMHEDHAEGLDIVRKAVPEAYSTMLDLMRNEAVSPSVRLKAAAEVADRADGKPVQRVTVESNSQVTYTTPEEIDAELARLNAELNHAMGRN